MICIKKLTLGSIFLSSINFAFAQKTDVAPVVDDFLTVKGIVVDSESVLEGAVVRLFKGNSKIDSVYTNKNGSFEFTLGKDYFYAIEYSRVGYENTCVLINTNRTDVEKENEDNAYQVNFEVELIDEIPNKHNLVVPAEDLDALDFPKVMIKYKNGEEEGFYPDNAYTKTIKESLKKIKVAAKAK
jgi:hypothetical protein